MNHMPATRKTMFLTENAASKRAMAVGVAIRSAWQSLAAGLKGRQGGELERYLAGSADRFEVERRERAWTRWRDSDGSLLGR
jgi:hypothetical protein